jgi:hypothetical protein
MSTLCVGKNCEKTFFQGFGNLRLKGTGRKEGNWEDGRLGSWDRLCCNLREKRDRLILSSLRTAAYFEIDRR